MQIKASDIAARVQGRLEGDGSAVVSGAASLADAGPSDLSFLRDADDARSLSQYNATRAAAVIVPRDFSGNGRTVIGVDNPVAAFSMVLGLLAQEAQVRPNGVHASAYVDPTAKIGKDVRIGPNCVVDRDAVIEDGACLMAQVYVGARSRVGQNSLLYPQVVLREGVSVGKNCILHAGAVIGADGYGYYFSGGRHNKIPQIGTVIIEDDVELGANTCIDRATTGATVVGRGTKVDNLVQIAHNCRIGPNCLIIAQVGMAGSCDIGTGVVLAGQVGLADHVKVGDGARIGAQSGLLHDVKPKAELWGTPAQPVGETMKQVVAVRRLPELLKEFKKMKEKFFRDA